jgi:hypothetical protein
VFALTRKRDKDLVQHWKDQFNCRTSYGTQSLRRKKWKELAKGLRVLMISYWQWIATCESRHDRFLPYPLKFLICLLSYYYTLYNLRTSKVSLQLAINYQSAWMSNRNSVTHLALLPSLSSERTVGNDENLSQHSRYQLGFELGTFWIRNITAVLFLKAVPVASDAFNLQFNLHFNFLLVA